MFCGRMKIASNAYHSIRALRTSHTRRLLSDASVAPQLATKIQIFNGLDEKYRYNRQSDVLVQFASSSVIGADIELNINGTSLDRAWLTAASYTNEQCIQKFIWLIAHLAANSDSTCITSQDYDAFVDQFTERLSVFSENEVLAALQIFAQMPLQKSVNMETRNFRELFMALDDNCARCAMDWDTDKRLAVCAIWRAIPMANKAKFIKMVCNKFVRDLDVLTAGQFVAAVFFINSMRQFIDDLDAFQRNFLRIIDDVTLEEIGLMCYPFNRITFRIHKAELIESILRRFVDGNVDEISDISINQLVKTIRISYRVNEYENMVKALDVLRNQLSRRSLPVCVRFLRVAEGVRLHDPAIIEKVLQRMPGNMKSLSLHDFADICRVLVVSGYKSPSGCERTVLPMILEEVRTRVGEIAFSVKTFHSLVYHLAILGYHDDEVLENALRKDFLNVVFKGIQFLDESVYGLSAFAEINLRNVYRGHLLPDKYKKKMKRVAQITAAVKDKCNRDVYSSNRMFKTMMKILDESCTPYRIGFALPHFGGADIYVSVDKSTGAIVDTAHVFPEPKAGTIVSKADFTADDPNIEVIAIAATYWNDYCRLTEAPNRLTQLKLEQLRLIGYRPLFMSFYSWVALDDAQKKTYMEDQLRISIEKISIVINR